MSGMDAIHIVGAGGIGCAVGYALLAAGVPVTFVETPTPRRSPAAGAHGVAVDRRPPLPADFVHFDDWTPAAGAAILLCTKCYDNAAVLARLPPRVRLLPIQNGFDPQLRRPRPRVEGIASFVSECAPRPAAHAHHPARQSCTSGGREPVAEATRSRSLLELGAAAAAGRRCFASTRCRTSLPYKHTKLMYNAAISPLAAAAGHRQRATALGAAARAAVLRAAAGELRHPDAGPGVARQGRAVPPDDGGVDPARPAVARGAGVGVLPVAARHLLLDGRRDPEGRTEIDNYNGHLIGLAGDGPCPLNRGVYRPRQDDGTQRLPPGPERLAGLLCPIEARQELPDELHQDLPVVG